MPSNAIDQNTLSRRILSALAKIAPFDVTDTAAFLQNQLLLERELSTLSDVPEGRSLMRIDGGSVGFWPRWAANSLLRLNDAHGAESASTRIARVMLLERASMKCITLIWGLNVSSPIQINGDLSIVPIASLPPSLQLSRTIDAVSPSAERIDSNLWEIPNVAIIQSSVLEPLFGPSPKPDPFEERRQNLVDLLLVLSVAEQHPILEYAGWFEFEDKDVESCCIMSGARRFQSHLIRPMMLQSKKISSPKDAIDMYVAMGNAEVAWRDNIRRSMRRFQRSMLNPDPPDAATDLFRSLEVLFEWKDQSGNGTVCRSAVFACLDPKERLETFDVLDALRQKRNVGAHGSNNKAECDSSIESIVDAARPAVAKIISLASRCSQRPDPKKLGIGIRVP